MARPRLITGMTAHAPRIVLFVFVVFATMTARADETNTALARANALFKDKNWAEARTTFDKAATGEKNWSTPTARAAVEGAVACSVHLQQWDDALQRAEQFVARTKGTLYEAVGERFLAGLYMTAPHHGTKRGENFVRGEWGRNYQDRWKQDRDEAIKHYERARTLLIGLSKKNKDADKERIDVDFDLTATLERQSEYTWGGGWNWWWADAETVDSAANDDADYDEPRSWRWNSGEKEIGIPVGPDGKPAFPQTPKNYSANLSAGEKFRFLLDEIQRLDKSKAKDDAAKAVFRRAMIDRQLYAPETSRDEDKATKPKKKVWELADDETLTRVGGKMELITLPKSENTIAILRDIQVQFPESSQCAEAQYALALYYQSRQQFPQAIREYQRLIEEYPKQSRVKDAREQLAIIARPEILLGETGMYLPGQNPKLAFTYRNADKAEFTARRIDLVKYEQDKSEKREFSNRFWGFFDDKKWTNYLRETVTNWSESVPRDPNQRVSEGSTLAPLLTPGAYIVEARIHGTNGPSRALVLITDIAMVEKTMVGKRLVFICDARTGQPLPDKSVRFYEHWQTQNKPMHHWDSTNLVTDANGVIEYKSRHPKQAPDINVIVTGESNRMAFSEFPGWNNGDPWRNSLTIGSHYYAVTDRPVYRPGSKVQYRVWLREGTQHGYKEPRAGQIIHLTIYDAKEHKVKDARVKTDEFGCVSGSYQLGDEPALGIYKFGINNYPVGGGIFRVEEYKKPEFEVLVKPGKSVARLGEKIKARIEAKYYYGAPVANAKVSYKIFREDYRQIYWGAGEYDWLYGRGYGLAHYACSWFPWWQYAGPTWADWSPEEPSYAEDRFYNRDVRRAERELISQGESALAADGSYEVEIDTSKANAELSDRDHRYTVEVEVRDASRRTIQGTGSVIVTRQEFYAFIESNAGWYEPRNEAFFEVRTLTANNEPVTTKGEVVVRRITYKDSLPEESIVRRWDAETDVDGRLSFKYPIPGEGQYRVTYTTHDSTNATIEADTVFWVNGPKFDGRIYRFNDLEIIADKRTYNVGDTAHLLVNTAENNARVLFSDDCSGGTIRSYRFIDIPTRFTVIDIPIKAKHLPNFFVEATLVRNGRVHSEMRELYVPPTNRLLNVAVQTDRKTYKPGESGKVSVHVTDADGKPASGQVTLTGYDRSVTYIQDEFGPSPRKFFYGEKRSHSVEVEDSLKETFWSVGRFQRPEDVPYSLAMPEGWYGNLPLGTNALSLDDVDGKSISLTRAVKAKTHAEDSLLTSGLRANNGALYSADATITGSYFGGIGGQGGTAAPAPATAVGYVKAVGVTELPAMKVNADVAGQIALAEPELRVNFADTAIWQPSLKLDDQGRAETNIVFPQSLTTWRLHAYALTPQTRVGDATNEATTTKNLIVLLESPRFFVERDEVVLSANVHNYLKNAKKVRAELIVPADLLSPADVITDKDGFGHLFAEADVSADGEHRFDWQVKAVKAGLAQITVKALTDEESDAMRMTFPVIVHGVLKTVAQSGSFRVSQEGTRTLDIEIPKQIDPEQTKLEVTLSPSLSAVLVDALPYLAGYPYGCVEQTMSRFYPSVLVKDTLQKMGTDLEAVAKQHRQMNHADVTNRFGRDISPVFKTGELNRMVKAGLEHIYNFQRSDGGWGWWHDDDSSAFQTSYVLQGLHAAIKAGVHVDRGVYDRGFDFLQNQVDTELAKAKDKQELGDIVTQAGIAYALSLEHRIKSAPQKKWLTGLYTNRAELNNYGRALLALAMKNQQRTNEAQMLLRNLLQFIDRDDSNETAWVRTPQAGSWFWWNNDIEANAWALKALVAIDPQNDLAPRIVKWLLNNRHNGYYWRSTRDTALVISAMTDYMRVSGEADPDYDLTLAIDGTPTKNIHINKENFFTFDNRVVLSGLHIKPGSHKISITKSGPGALYYSAYASYFTKQEDVRSVGNEIFVRREYFKLIPKTEKVQVGKSWWGDDKVKGHTEVRDGYQRITLKNGDALKSGDKIEVVLNITAKNNYDYLAFEDMKLAGCEPVELRSGGRWAGGLCANVELRDQKVVFFIGMLEQGENVLRYKLRAETPGQFHALPTKGFAMYAPEIKTISDEMRLTIKE